jgi:hypothetical protein
VKTIDLERDTRSIEERILSSCCHGIGIGQPRDLKQALVCCIQAGALGDVASKLTSISLFDALSLTTSDNVQLETETVTLIERWRKGYLIELTEAPQCPEDEGAPCRLMLLERFNTTPASRFLCINYPSIRNAPFFSMCSCCRQSSKQDIPGSAIMCGQELLKRLLELLQRRHNGDVTGSLRSFLIS